MTYDDPTDLNIAGLDADLDRRLRLFEDLGLGRPDQEFDDFAARLAVAAGEPYAMVNLMGIHQTFVGLHSPADGDLPSVDRTMPRDHGYCPEVVERARPLILTDVYAHPRFAGNPVVDRIGIRTYAGAPLIHEPTGTVLGTVCVVGPVERPQETGQARLELIKEHRDALMDLIYRRSGRLPQ